MSSEPQEKKSKDYLEKIDVAGMKISPIRKKELLSEIVSRIKLKQKTTVFTPYSEFLYASFQDPHFRQVINRADFAIADGVGILWADLFLSVPLTLKNFYLNILQAWWQVVWTGASILLRPSYLYKNIPEKIVGADLSWDLVRVAAENNFTVYLLGARGNVAELAAQKYLTKFPNLKVVGTSNKDMDDPSIISDLQKAQPDMLLVAFKAQAAEQWIETHLHELPVHFVIALGGTFDYIAGIKKQPPKFVRAVGLEWLYRLITQPSRLGRIFNATWGMVLGLVRHKVFLSMPFRQNAVAIVQNSEKQILIVKRNPKDPYLLKTGWSGKGYKFENYWQFCRGGMERNESYKDAAQRELKEELGVFNVEYVGSSNQTRSYIWQNSARPLMGRTYRNKGQNQNLVYFKFTGSGTEPKPDGREIVNYKWVPLTDLVNEVHAEQKDLAEIVVEDLR